MDRKEILLPKNKTKQNKKQKQPNKKDKQRKTKKKINGNNSA